MGLERKEIEATPQAGMTFVQFVQDIAAKAKLSIAIKGPELVMVPWDLAEGRKQNTFVRPMGRTGAGHFIVGFFSPARKVAAGEVLDAALASELLRKSARLAHGSWCIASVGGDEYLGVCDTQIASSMQPEEFYASCLAPAQVADAYEKTLGTDAF